MEERQSSKVPFIAGVIAVIAIIGVIVFLLNNQQAKAPTSNQTETTSDTSNTSDEGAAAPSERMTITFKDGGFEPETITVKKGTAITVKNESSRDVKFSSADHPTHRLNSEMNLDTLSPGESTSYTATKVGTWGYHDHLDSSKTGVVIVTE